MRIDRPLDDAFRTRSHVRVLRALDELPAGFAVSARELARRAGISHPTASSVLASLAEQGAVARSMAPRADLFRLNEKHVLTERLRPLFAWERQLRDELVSVLRQEIRQHAAQVRAAYLFGSVARGEATATSDIDVAVRCSPDQADEVNEAMSEVAEVVRSRFGNRLNVIVGVSAAQLRGADRRGRRLWDRIAREGIPIIEPAKERG
jgi:predicted nucleotidyltransferase